MSATPSVGESKLIVGNDTTAECIGIWQDANGTRYLMRYYDTENKVVEVWATEDQLSEGLSP